jgi:deazaflavin-dependent oxidoreductase (nitroreductase family)
VILSYAHDGEDLLVVASWGGSPTAPSWFHNLKRNPAVQVNLGTKRSSLVAIPVYPGDADYARLWRIVVSDMSPNYDLYQRRTTRPIPVVRLTPAQTTKQ